MHPVIDARGGDRDCALRIRASTGAPLIHAPTRSNVIMQNTLMPGTAKRPNAHRRPGSAN
jgi:hypothetical protein